MSAFLFHDILAVNIRITKFEDLLSAQTAGRIVQPSVRYPRENRERITKTGLSYPKDIYIHS